MLGKIKQKKAHATPRKPLKDGHRRGLRQNLPTRLPRTHLLAAAGIATAVFTVLAVMPGEKVEANRQNTTAEISATQAATNTEFVEPVNAPLNAATAATAKPSLSIQQPAANLESENVLNWLEVTVKSGDSLSTLFGRATLSAKDVYDFINANADTKQLKRLMPGEVLSFGLDGAGSLSKMRYHKSQLESWEFHRTTKGFTANHVVLTPELVPTYKEAVINDSLFVAADRAQMPQNLIMELANIFGWDIDFALDIRKGDSFSVVYEEKFLNGENIGPGNILAAEFNNQGKSYRAVRYEDDSGNISYYTPEGLNMRKAFLRAPLDFMYVSSNFNPKRFHPILKRWKAHRGIDYRARTGTPVRAAGDGTVIASSRNKYNGKYVFIQHGNGIVTKYLHLSKRTVSRGKKVKQGQIIGHVGATGLAQAPHLHYEFVVNGVHRNPRTVKLPDAEPIAQEYKSHFLAQTKPLLVTLAQHRRQSLLAQSENKATDNEG